MFNRKTLFVLGAGASYEVGLPTGVCLAQRIAKCTEVGLDTFGRLSKGTADYDFAETFFTPAGAPRQYTEAFAAIREAILLSRSIDDFLNIHASSPAIVEVGKAAIIHCILKAERASVLQTKSEDVNKLDVEKVLASWFVKFMRVLGPDNRVPDVEFLFEKVQFIVFNYDRCLEYFLKYAVHQLYRLPLLKAEEIVRAATIIHPYGSIADLKDVPFGGVENKVYDYKRLLKNIKTYNEQIADQKTGEDMQQAIDKADCIVFLGFAYHKPNMALLKPTKPPTDTKLIYGTAYGMSDDDKQDVVEMLGARYRGQSYEVGANAHVRIENKLKCSELFDNYARSIGG